MIVLSPLQDTALATATCDAADSVGTLVYVSGSKVGADYAVTKADPSLYAKVPVVGVITYKLTPTRAVVQFRGEVRDIYSGLTPGRTYFLGDAGTPVLTPPTPGGGEKRYVQVVGVAVDSGILSLIPSSVDCVTVG